MWMEAGGRWRGHMQARDVDDGSLAVSAVLHDFFLL